MRQDDTVGVTARLDYGVDDSGFESRQGQEIFLFRPPRTGSVAHPAPYSRGTRVPSPEENCRGVKLTSHIHLVPKLSMNEAVPLLPLYGFIGCPGTNLHFSRSRRSTEATYRLILSAIHCQQTSAGYVAANEGYLPCSITHLVYHCACTVFHSCIKLHGQTGLERDRRYKREMDTCACSTT